MDELKERFQALDDLEFTKTEQDFFERQPGPPIRDRPSPGRRGAVILLALVIAAAGVDLTVRAFRDNTGPIPIASRANGPVAFKPFGHTGEIWLLDPSASAPTLLATLPGASQLAWSPLGTRLAVVATGGIWLVAPGEDPVLVYPCSKSCPNRFPYPAFVSWSPDGSELAFGTRNGTIDIVAADGSGFVRRISIPGLRIFDPSWSPDGTRFAFEDANSRSVYTVGRDGTDLRRIADHAGEPAWSPDASQVAFVDLRFGKLDVVDASGGDERTIFDCGVQCNIPGFPEWSPDGSEILFRSAEGTTPPPSGGTRVLPQLYVVDVDGSDPHVFPLSDRFRGVGGYSWQAMPERTGS